MIQLFFENVSIGIVVGEALGKVKGAEIVKEEKEECVSRCHDGILDCIVLLYILVWFDMLLVYD